MVQILPEAPSFGTQFARGIGAGLSAGVGKGADFASQLGMEKAKGNIRRKYIDQIEGGKSSKPNQMSPQDMEAKFLEALPEIENHLGRGLEPQELDQMWKHLQSGGMQSQGNQQKPMADPMAKAKQYAAIGEHDLSRVAAEEAKMGEKRKAEERSIFKKGAEDYFTKLNEDRERLPVLESALEAQTNAVLSGDVDPFSQGHIADIAKSMGVPNTIAAMLETPGSKSFKTGLKTYLSSTLKDAFRGTTTGREIDLAEGLLAQAGASKEANLASLWLLQSNKMIMEKKIELADQLESQGVSPYDIAKEVDKQLRPYRKEISKQYFEALQELKGKK